MPRTRVAAVLVLFALAFPCPALAAEAAAPQGAPPAESPGPQASPRIHWRPWGSAALKEAADSNRPVLLYISAAWDHFDQVMNDLTYTDPSVVGVVEGSYIPVKVDTDERPDIFVRLGMGGWPTTSVVLPDGEPMYYPDPNGKVTRAGGRFFPPGDFVSYFKQLAGYYAEHREMVQQVTRNIDDAILGKRNVGTGPVTSESMEAIVAKVLESHKNRAVVPEVGDHYPDFDMVDLAYFYWAKKADRKVLDMGLDHLTDMARGGIYDRLGGGFHRYAKDSMWVVPAFEKTPEINARAISSYLRAFEVTGNGKFLVMAERTIEHVQKHGIDPASHAFIGAMSAGVSAEDNGDYYTWTEDEVKAALTSEEFAIASIAWNVFPLGEMIDTAPKRNVLFVAEGPKALAMHLKVDEKHAEEVLESARIKLLAVRDTRTAPPVDPRSFGDRSSMMISAFFQAGRTLHRPELIRQAFAALDLMLARCRTERGLIAHVCDPAGGTRSVEGYLSDQANAATALLDAHEENGNSRYLTEARALADRSWGMLRDSISGGLSDRDVDPNAPGLMSWPMKDLADNMVMARALIRLGHLSGEKGYLDKAGKLLESWADEIGDYEDHGAPYALASQMFLTPPLEVLVAYDPNTPKGEDARERALNVYHPWRIVRHLSPSKGREEMAKRGLKAIEGPQIAFCVDKECAGPFDGAEPVRRYLEAFLNRGRGAAGAAGAGTKSGEGN